jgi:hypothetical protein
MRFPFTFAATWVASFLMILTAAAQEPISAPSSVSRPAISAVGDGKADDTQAIQRAVDSGGAIRLPKGVYRITRPILVNLDTTGFVSLSGDGVARLVMAGAGPALRLIGTHHGTADPSTVKPDVWQRQRMPTIDGLEIVGDHLDADGIQADGTMQLTITRALIREVRHAIHLVGRNRNLLVGLCHIYHNRGAGVFYDHVSLHQSNITGCHISYCAGGGIVARGGDVFNVQITGCDIEGNMDPKAPSSANVLLDGMVNSGEIEITGCTIQHNDTTPNSANIRILGHGEPLPKGKGPLASITIGHNVLSEVQVNIEIQHTRNVTITGNMLDLGYAQNLLVEKCRDVVVGPNVLARVGYTYGTCPKARNALVFRDCQDCTLTGLHVNNVYRAEAGLTLDNCRRFNVSGCSILDCEGVGLLARNLSLSRISDCLIVNNRAAAPLSLRLVGGAGNMIVNNLLGNPYEIAPNTGLIQGNYSGK